jgi:hypothetical protein
MIIRNHNPNPLIVQIPPEHVEFTREWLRIRVLSEMAEKMYKDELISFDEREKIVLAQCEADEKWAKLQLTHYPYCNFYEDY